MIVCKCGVLLKRKPKRVSFAALVWRKELGMCLDCGRKLEEKWSTLTAVCMNMRLATRANRLTLHNLPALSRGPCALLSESALRQSQAVAIRVY